MGSQQATLRVKNVLVVLLLKDINLLNLHDENVPEAMFLSLP